MDDGITVRGVHIPESELQWRFTTSGGPGGQHANRSNTAAEVRFDVTSSEALPTRLRDRVRRRLAGQMTRAGELIVVSADHRSQTRNRETARGRLRDLLVEATAPPAQRRRQTRPSRAARQRRLDDKRHRGRLKEQRKRPDW